MNAQAITNKIVEDAKIAASETLAQAHARVDELRHAYEESAASKRQQALEQAQSDAGVLRDRMLRMAELDQRKAQLAVKREVIDQAFADALERMRAMDDESKRAYIERAILESAAGGEELIASDDEAGLYTESFLNTLNAKLNKAGKAPITLAGTPRKLGGGCLLKQGGMEINLTYPAAMNEMRSSLEADVAKILFD